jgi:alpha-L-fucosidase
VWKRLFYDALSLLLPVIATTVANAAQPSAATTGAAFTRTTPRWFDEAKLGIFVHWNAASIPAFAPVTSVAALKSDNERNSQSDPLWELRKLPYAEMYQLPMMIPGSATARYHAEHYGTMPYDGFVAQFRDEMIPGWDPKAWATFFTRAGARYVVLSTKTEDGFLLWPSAHRNPRKEGWQSRRDAVGDLASAVRAEGLRFGTYYCGDPDWTFGGLTPPGSEMPATEEYRAYVDAHWRELIERYRPEVLWSDGAYPGAGTEADKLDPATRKHIEDLFRFYAARVPDGVINNRFGTSAQNAGTLYFDFATPEYSVAPSSELPERTRNNKFKWEANRGLGTSYGYNAYENEDSYMSGDDLIHMFVNIVAWGGNLLINVGPMSTGEIPWLQARPLLELGWWLRTNGEAIYGSHRWIRPAGISGDGLQVRYTAAKDATRDAVFAILLGSPKSRTVELDLRLAPQTTVSLEGWGGKLKWTATPTGVRIELPMLPDERPAWSLRFSPQAGVQPL